MVVYTSNSITGEAEAGEMLGIQGHQELHSKNLSKTNKQTNQQTCPFMLFAMLGLELGS